MKYTDVQSSNIGSIGHDGSNLGVKYRNGTTYIYENVPKELYESFLKSESKGKFMNSEIKNKFTFKKES